MAYYLGIDGGGTKTRCILADETNVIAKAMAGGSNVIRLGEARAKEALQTVINQVCVIAKISPDEIQAICFGAAGAARPEIVARIYSILEEIVPQTKQTRIEIVGDTVIALEAAFGPGPGVIAIAGTGSVVYGRDAAGHTARSGGWGFAVSDEGSGHWIGLRAIHAILSAHDRGIETALTTMVLEAWRLTTLDQLVQQANSAPPPDFPRLFPIVLRASDEADSTAHDLLADAGIQLANLAAVVVRRLAPQNLKTKSPAFPSVAMTGSVFRQSLVVRQFFYDTLKTTFPAISIRKELADPVEGALARARRGWKLGLPE
jgi:glucosamine kinase